MADERSPVEIELEMLIRARYPIIYIVSWEEKRVEETLRDICQRRGKTMMLWTFTTGMAGNVAQRDPMAALDYIMNAPDQTVFVLKDFHPFISDVGVTRRLRDLIYILKSSYKHIVILTPILKLPAELEKEITVVDYQLPTVAELDRLLEGVIQTVRADPRLNIELSMQEREQVLQAASGLTSIEAENVFAKSLVEKRQFDIDVILGEKEQIIRKSGILEYYRATEAFAEVGGLDLLKEWLRQRTASFGKEARDYGLPEPRGMLLLGVQGSGKSLTAKAIASLWRLPLLRLDIGKVFSGIVGSSEENMRRAISTAESVAPCVAGDTRITLADGSEKTIEELYNCPPETLSVLGMTSDWQIAPVGVRAVTRRPAPDLFTIRLRHGKLQATSNHLHPVLRNGQLEWVRTDALKTGDQIAMPTELPGSDKALPIQAQYANSGKEAEILLDAEEDDTIPVGSMLQKAWLAVTGVELPGAKTGSWGRNQLRVAIAQLRERSVEQGRIVPEIDSLSALAESPILWSPVLSITPEDAPEFVYDLVCDDPHNFIANGIVTHNCILWIDELEKGLSGTQSSGATDGGTTSRVFSTFLTWLSEKKAPVFVVATSNDVQQLPPELMRKGRFDEIFFVDLPATNERREIFEIHLKKRKRDPEKFDMELLGEASAGYSGAEIEQAVVGALFSAFHDGMREMTTEDLHRTIKASVPLSITMREGIQRLRQWAETRARQASSEQSETMEQLANLEVARLFDAAEEAERQRKEIAAARSGTVAPKAITNGESEYKMEDDEEDDDENEESNTPAEAAPITTNTPARPKRVTKKEVKGDG